MEEKKEEIEFMETRANIMCPPEIQQESSYKRNFPKLQEPKASQIMKDKKTLDKTGEKRNRTGREPASLREETHPDWVPSINMGYDSHDGFLNEVPLRGL
ncbi:hypothetical protein JTB14_037517 [Gonioctena quinquepunctata]|nr:hypothetical protein JTB14_037517 [Gonioctena quinquepunctata]